MDTNNNNNVFSIYTKKEPCQYMHVSNREFINLTTSVEGTEHITVHCPDCNYRYSIVSKLLMRSYGY